MHARIADLIWMATASLSREFPGSCGFTDDEICHRLNELKPGSRFSIRAIRKHIATHSVASKKPDPRNQRKLYANEDGTYRLYWSKDLHHAQEEMTKFWRRQPVSR